MLPAERASPRCGATQRASARWLSIAHGNLLASAGSDKTIRLWDIKERSCIGTLSGHEGTIQQLAFAPDGRQLASAGSDKTVRLWDVSQGQAMGMLTGPEKFTTVRFSPDGRTVAAADEDGVITLWEVASGIQLGSLRDEARVLRAWHFPLTAGSSLRPARPARSDCGTCSLRKSCIPFPITRDTSTRWPSRPMGHRSRIRATAARCGSAAPIPFPPTALAA